MSANCTCDPNFGLTPNAINFKNNPSGRLGPWNMGAMFAWLLQGILLAQVSFYFRTYKQDTFTVRAFVGGVAVMNIFKSVMCGSTLWVRSVDKFGDWNGITRGYWPQRSQVLVSELICFVVHLYFILRVFRLTKRNYFLAAFLGCCSLLGVSGGIVFQYMIYKPNPGNKIIRFDMAMTTMLVGLLVCDLTITTTIFVTLLKSKTKFSHTESLINRLIRLTWMSAAPPTLCAALNLAFYEAVKSSDTFVSFNIVLSYLASMSMMYTINSRNSAAQGIMGSSADVNNAMSSGTRSGGVGMSVFSLSRRPRTANQDEYALDVKSGLEQGLHPQIKVHTEVHQVDDRRHGLGGGDPEVDSWDAGRKGEL